MTNDVWNYFTEEKRTTWLFYSVPSMEIEPITSESRPSVGIELTIFRIRAQRSNHYTLKVIPWCWTRLSSRHTRNVYQIGADFEADRWSRQYSKEGITFGYHVVSPAYKIYLRGSNELLLLSYLRSCGRQYDERTLRKRINLEIQLCSTAFFIMTKSIISVAVLSWILK